MVLYRDRCEDAEKRADRDLGEGGLTLKVNTVLVTKAHPFGHCVLLEHADGTSFSSSSDGTYKIDVHVKKTTNEEAVSFTTISSVIII